LDLEDWLDTIRRDQEELDCRREDDV
jgi:hypothetical protein